MVALLARLFPRPVSAERTPNSSNGLVMHAESNNITCKWLSIWSQPDKWSISTCIQHLPKAIKKLRSFSWWYQNEVVINPIQRCLGGETPSKTTILQHIITCNLFSKSSSRTLTFNVIKKQPFNYFFFSHPLHVLPATNTLFRSLRRSGNWGEHPLLPIQAQRKFLLYECVHVRQRKPKWSKMRNPAITPLTMHCRYSKNLINNTKKSGVFYQVFCKSWV